MGYNENLLQRPADHVVVSINSFAGVLAEPLQEQEDWMNVNTAELAGDPLFDQLLVMLANTAAQEAMAKKQLEPLPLEQVLNNFRTYAFANAERFESTASAVFAFLKLQS